MKMQSVEVVLPDNANVVIGQSHFIKTVEDIYEVIVSTVPQAKFGVAFCEASGPCLVRVDGNDEDLMKSASENAMSIGAGHTFVIILRDSYPINIMNRLRDVQEICTIFCATANPLDVVVVENERGRGVIGVIDGERPKGVETEKDADDRKALLRKFGYKR
ncbi:MAG: adenosine-specific kinase [Thermoplasmata archaeon]|nr:adenosine-specific kinase [Thermoplasmata archaeon]MCJ7561434.1 adenosine-specific kinase [Thermoplasmata archaeon]TFG70424.1 MAG: adenosine monophosphate-protein transferase [Methanomassiliicoccus sp.]